MCLNHANISWSCLQAFGDYSSLMATYLLESCEVLGLSDLRRAPNLNMVSFRERYMGNLGSHSVSVSGLRQLHTEENNARYRTLFTRPTLSAWEGAEGPGCPIY